LDNCIDVPVEYTLGMVRYQTEYFALQDLSRVIYHDRKPVGVWPLGLREESKLTSNGTEILPPLLVGGLPERVHKRIIADCLREVQALCERHGVFQWWSKEVEVGEGLSLWHRRIMEHGGRASVDHELYIDLLWDYDDIWANIRKSYRSLVTAGQKLYTATISGQVEPLKELHLEVVGHATRSDATWERQQDALDEGEAFCVYLHDGADKLVGGALFHYSHSEAYYAIGVYDRKLRSKPLGHVVQATAIPHMQALGLRLYHLGLRPYVADEKELSIAHFKEGWATHVYPRVTTSLLRA
jgi:FemAB family protein